MQSGQAIISLLIFAVIAIALFLVFREIVCWYYKINDLVSIQKRQLLLLTALLESQRLEGSQRSDYITKSLDAIQDAE